MNPGQTSPFNTAAVARLLLPLCLFIGTGGCTDADTEVNVARDGSGTVRLQVLIRDDARSRMAHLAGLANPLGLSTAHPLGAWLHTLHEAGGDPLSALYRRELLEEWGREMGPDVTLTQLRKIERGSKEHGFEAWYRFPDIRSVQWTSPSDGTNPTDRLTFDFQPGTRPILILRSEPGRPKIESGPRNREAGILSRFGAWTLGRAAAEGLRGLRLRLTIRTESPAWAPGALFRPDEVRILLAEIEADAMSRSDLLRLVLALDLTDLESLAHPSPPGLRLQPPRRPLAIVMAPE